MNVHQTQSDATSTGKSNVSRVSPSLLKERRLCMIKISGAGPQVSCLAGITHQNHLSCFPFLFNCPYSIVPQPHLTELQNLLPRTVCLVAPAKQSRLPTSLFEHPPYKTSIKNGEVECGGKPWKITPMTMGSHKTQPLNKNFQRRSSWWTQSHMSSNSIA